MVVWKRYMRVDIFKQQRTFDLRIVFGEDTAESTCIGEEFIEFRYELARRPGETVKDQTEVSVNRKTGFADHFGAVSFTNYRVITNGAV